LLSLPSLSITHHFQSLSIIFPIFYPLSAMIHPPQLVVEQKQLVPFFPPYYETLQVLLPFTNTVIWCFTKKKKQQKNTKTKQKKRKNFYFSFKDPKRKRKKEILKKGLTCEGGEMGDQTR
jgi:hypothetical protein